MKLLNVKLTFTGPSIGLFCVCRSHTLKKKESEHLSLPLHFSHRKINDHPTAPFTSFTNNLLALWEHLYCWFYKFKRKWSFTMFFLHVTWLLSPALNNFLLDYCSFIMLQTFTTHLAVPEQAAAAPGLTVCAKTAAVLQITEHLSSPSPMYWITNISH